MYYYNGKAERQHIYLLTPDRRLLGILNGVDEQSCSIKKNAQNTYELSFTVYKMVDGVKSAFYDHIEELMCLYVDGVYYIINEPPQVTNDGLKSEYLEISAESAEIQLQGFDLQQFKIGMGSTESYEIQYYNKYKDTEDYEYKDSWPVVTLYNPTDPELSLLHLALYHTGMIPVTKVVDEDGNVTWDWVSNIDKGLWKIGTIDPVPKTKTNYKGEQSTYFLADESFAFDIDSQDLYSFLTQNVSQAFSCIFFFDTVNRTINAYYVEHIGEDTNVYIGWRNIQDNLTGTRPDQLYTAATVSGGEGIDNISYANFGSSEIEDYSYFMDTRFVPQSLIGSYNQWVKYRETRRQEYIDLRKQWFEESSIIKELQNRVPTDGVQNDWTGMNPDELQSAYDDYTSMINALERLYVDKDGNFDLEELKKHPEDWNTYEQIMNYILPEIVRALQTALVSDQIDLLYSTNRGDEEWVETMLHLSRTPDEPTLSVYYLVADDTTSHEVTTDNTAFVYYEYNVEENAIILHGGSINPVSIYASYKEKDTFTEITSKYGKGNLIYNPTFTSTAEWDRTDGRIAMESIQTDGLPVYGTMRYLHVGLGADEKPDSWGIYQDSINLIPDNYYVLSAFIKSASSQTIKFFFTTEDIEQEGSEHRQEHSLAISTGWTRVYWKFHVGTETMSPVATIGFLMGNADSEFDICAPMLELGDLSEPSSFGYFQQDDDVLKSYSTDWKLYGTVELQNLVDNYRNQYELLNAYVTDDGSSTYSDYSRLHQKYLDYRRLYNEAVNALTERQADVDKHTELMENINAQAEAIEVAVQRSNYLTDDEEMILKNLYKHTDYTNENIVVTNVVDRPEEVDSHWELWYDATDNLYASAHPQYSWEDTIDNILGLEEFKNITTPLELFSYVHVEIEDDVFSTLRLIGMEYNPLIYQGDFKLTFSTITKYKNHRDDFSQLIDNAIKSSKNSIKLGSNTSNTASYTITPEFIKSILNNAAFKQGVGNISGSIAADSITANFVGTKLLQADEAKIDKIKAELVDTDTVIARIVSADQADIDNITAKVVTSDSVSTAILNVTDQATIENLSSKFVSADKIVTTMLEVTDTAKINSLRSKYIDTDTIVTRLIDADEGDIDELRSKLVTAEAIKGVGTITSKDGKSSINFDDGTIVFGDDFSYDSTKGLNVPRLDTAEANIGTLTADNATIKNKLSTAEADIGTLTADNATIKNKLSAAEANITNLTAKDAEIETLVAGKANITDLDAEKARIDDLNAKKANIDLANVNNAWIENGVIKDAAISDAQILGMSANKLTAGTIDAANVNVANLRARNLIVEKLNGQPILGGYELVSRNSSGYAGKNPSEEGWYEYVNGEFVKSMDTTVDMNKAYYRDSESVALYDQTYIDGLANGLNERIDGAIETFTGTDIPLLDNYPAVDWPASAYASHVGDVYYVVNAGSQADGYCYRFAFDTTTQTYGWILIKDSDVTAALQRLLDAEGDISGLKTFESTTTAWKTETDEELSSIKGRTTTVETLANQAVKSSEQLWFSKADATAPAAPTAKVTSTATTGNAWTTVVPAYDATYPNYFYCWQYEYNDGSYGWSAVVHDIAMDETQNTARTANDTANANVSKTTMLWFSKADKTAPAAPTSHVSSDKTTGNGWRTVVPTYNADYPHYYYCYEYLHGDGSYTWGDVVYDSATSEAQANSQSALQQVATKVETSVFNEVKQTVDENSAAITSLSTTIETKADGSTVETISNTVNEVSQKANENENKITQLTKTVSDNETDIEKKYSDLHQDVEGFKLDVGETYHKISDFNTFKTENDDAVADAKKAGTDAQSNLNTYKTTVADTYAAKADAVAEEQYIYITKAETATAPGVNTTWVAQTGDVQDTWTTRRPTYDEDYPVVYVAKQRKTVSGVVSCTTPVKDTTLTSVESNFVTKTTFDVNNKSIKGQIDSVETNTKTYADGKIDQEVKDRNAAIEAKADEISLAVSSVDSKIDNLEIGGRNLLKWTEDPKYIGTNQRKSDDSTGWYAWNGNCEVVETDDGIKYTNKTTSPNGLVIPLVRDDAVEGEETLVLSFNYRANYTGNGSLYLLCRTGSNVMLTFSNVEQSETEWKHFEQIFNFPDHENRFAYAIMFPYRGTVDEWLEIKDRSMKLEKGNKATAWSPAPEDLTSYTDNVVATARAEIKVTTDTITTEVGKKVGNDEVISRINQSPESITIDAEKVNIAGAAIFQQYTKKSDFDDLTESVQKIEDALELDIVYEWGTTNVTLNAVLMQNGEDIHTKYPESLYAWNKESQNEITFLGNGYQIVIPRSSLNYVSAIDLSLGAGEPAVLRFPDGNGLRFPDGKILTMVKEM